MFCCCVPLAPCCKHLWPHVPNSFSTSKPSPHRSPKLASLGVQFGLKVRFRPHGKSTDRRPSRTVRSKFAIYTEWEIDSCAKTPCGRKVSDRSSDRSSGTSSGRSSDSTASTPPGKPPLSSRMGGYWSELLTSSNYIYCLYIIYNIWFIYITYLLHILCILSIVYTYFIYFKYYIYYI